MISTYVRRSMVEERYELKGSRTVLKRGLGSDTHSYFNVQILVSNGDSDHLTYVKTEYFWQRNWELRWLFWRLKRAWPKVKIILRGDAGFSLPELIKICERSEVTYAFGFTSNAVLKRKINYLLDKARLQYIHTGEKVRLFDDVYYAAKSWDKPRRIIMKAEWLEKGANPRFVVTNMLTDAQTLYDQFYVKRGATSEHRIKELKLGIKADRLSCQSFMVNQFRLFLSQAAYILMLSLRKAAEGTKLATASVTRLRERIIKIAAKVSVSVRRVLVELTAHCPFQEEIRLIAQRLTNTSQVIFS